MARTNAEYFEYDEDLESEAFESDESDEGFESDESDEGFESDESDEGFESDESDEGFESDESDESDEGFESDESDEAVKASYSARIAARDRARGAAWQRTVNADMRADARRALANQQRLNQRLRNASRTKTQAAPNLRGAGVVTLRLPNGRQTRAMISPRPALASEVNRLRSVLATNDRRQAQALAKVSSAQAAAVKQLTAQMIRGDKDVAKRVVQGHNALHKRITKEIAGHKGNLDKQRKLLARDAKMSQTRQLQNALLLGSSIPIWSRQIDSSNLLAERNVKMAASNVFWLFSDEIFGALQGGKNKGWTKNLGWFAIAGNIATMLYLGHDEQLERFVSGVFELDAGGTRSIKMSELSIAKNYEKDFEKVADPRTVVTYAGGITDVTTANELVASWAGGVLTLRGQASAKVAVLVDTWEKNAE